MSSGNWLYRIAIGGCLAALFLASALAQEVQPPVSKSQPETESGQNAGKRRSKDEGQKEKATPEQLAPALGKIEAAIRDSIAQQRAAQSQGPEDHEISDLKAQEGMAFWAKLMFWATVAAVILTVAGIILIWRTLHHTRRAADFARDMLGEAEITAEATRKQVEWLIKIERPHILVASMHTNGFGTVMQAQQEPTKPFVIANSLDVKNEGTRHGILHSYYMERCDKLPLEPVRDQTANEWIGRFFVAAGENCIVPDIQKWGITFKEALPLNDRKKNLFVHGFIRYEDIHGTMWRSGFAFVYIPNNERLRDGHFDQCGPRHFWYDVEQTREPA